jgi:hypothetical protein
MDMDTKPSEKIETSAHGVNPEYERYLDLHRQFEGPARKTLIRKRKYFAQSDDVVWI